MPQVIDGPTSETFRVAGPIFCPYYNLWGKDVYTRGDAFADNPFTVLALSTSGSPAVIDAEGRFFHFLSDNVEAGCGFAFDGGHTLTVEVPRGQRLYIDTDGDSDAAWRRCNRLIMDTHQAISPTKDRLAHWDMIEYCTWVEQKQASAPGQHPLDVINDTFLDDYMSRVEAMGLPKGKFTIDHGWTIDHDTYGDWEANPAKFPRLENTIQHIADRGFVPGLWLAPVWLHHDSRAARNHPHLRGDPVAPGTLDTNFFGQAWHYWKPCEETGQLMRPVFERFIGMGVRKFKCDMIYGNKAEMKQLHRLFYRAVKEIDPEVEVEIHQPDIFFTPYGDAIRTNDVLCTDRMPDWRNVARAHIDVCTRSAPGQVINLDHIGGNDPDVTEADFLEHLSMYHGVPGYPVVSLLPDSISPACVEALRDYLEQYQANPTPVSGFFADEA